MCFSYTLALAMVLVWPAASVAAKDRHERLLRDEVDMDYRLGDLRLQEGWDGSSEPEELLYDVLLEELESRAATRALARELAGRKAFVPLPCLLVGLVVAFDNDREADAGPGLEAGRRAGGACRIGVYVKLLWRF